MECPKYFYFRVKPNRNGTVIEMEDASDVDVVEVVRCGECWKRDKEDYCPLVSDSYYLPNLPDDWFCADGKRRTDET